MLEKQYAINFLKYLLITDSGHEAEADDGSLKKLNNLLGKYGSRLGREKCNAIENIVNNFFVRYKATYGSEEEITFSPMRSSFSNYWNDINQGRQPK